MSGTTPNSQLEVNPIDAAIGMRLAFWSYPHKDAEAATRVTPYPDAWRHAKPHEDLPPGFNEAVRDPSGRITQEGWNTQHNADGKLENQFQVSINRTTHQITFDFKGSDAWSNWKSDLGNAGASEFAQIQEQAQKALEALQQDERYKGYSYAATGHSLGGGMAQSFALHNQLDAYVYNSLPMARDTIAGDYFKEQGGFQAALAQYKDSGRTVHDVRTPNDIATFTFEGVMQNQYLSQHVRPGVEVLPGAAVPDLLKAALVFSKVGTVPALAIMGKDHTMGALLDAQQGLGVDERSGRYRIPEGQVDFAAIPPNVRKQFALLDHSPVTKVFQYERGGTNEGDSSAYDRFKVQREDGSTQRLSVHKASGDVEIDHRHPDGRRTVLEFNAQQPEQVKTTEYDAQGTRVNPTQPKQVGEYTPERPNCWAFSTNDQCTKWDKTFTDAQGDRVQVSVAQSEPGVRAGTQLEVNRTDASGKPLHHQVVDTKGAPADKLMGFVDKEMGDKRTLANPESTKENVQSNPKDIGHTKDLPPTPQATPTGPPTHQALVDHHLKHGTPLGEAKRWMLSNDGASIGVIHKTGAMSEFKIADVQAAVAEKAAEKTATAPTVAAASVGINPGQPAGAAPNAAVPAQEHAPAAATEPVGRAR